MSDFWTAPRIAELVGNSLPAVLKRLRKAQILGRKRTKGKGLEYALTDLPADWQAKIREALADHSADTSKKVEPAPATEPKTDTRGQIPKLPPPPPPRNEGSWLEIVRDHPAPTGTKATQRMQARLLLLMIVGPWCEAQGIGKKVDCELRFCEAFNQHLIQLPAWLYDQLGSVSRATIQRWRQLQQQDATLLKGQFARAKGGLISANPEVEAEVQAALAHIGPTAGPTNTLRVLRGSMLHPEALPSYGQLQRYLLELRTEDPATWLNLTNPKAHRDSMAVAVGSRSRGLWPNDKWEIDFTRNDVLLRINGEVARFAVGLCVDVATRRRRAILSPAPKGEATAELLARCVREWGIPRVLVPDNGKEFINQRVTRFAAALGCVVDPPPPGTPQGKPHVERAFGYLNGTMETLPSFVGHNTGQRAEIRKHKGEDNLVNMAMEAPTFQQWLDLWCTETEQAKHESLGRSPLEQLQRFVGQGWEPVPCTLSDQALTELCCQSWERKAGRSHISIEGRRYITEQLGLLVGKPLLAYSVPEDICRVRLYSPDMAEFYGEAQWDIYMTREEQAEAAAKAKTLQSTVRAKSAAVKRRGKQITKGFEKRPDRLLSPTAELEVMQAMAEPLREPLPQAEPKLVAIPSASAQPAPAAEEPPSRWGDVWVWFAWNYERRNHEADPELRAAMAQELTDTGKFQITSELQLDPDAAYALGIEFGLDDYEAGLLRDERAKKQKNQQIYAEQRRRFA